jgi:hypothetical protein
MLALLAALTVAASWQDTLPAVARFPSDTVRATAVVLPRDTTAPVRGESLVLLAPVQRFPRPQPPRLTLSSDSAAQAIEHSDLYYTRLTIHRWTSYAAVPLLVAQYVVGQQLDDGGGSRGTHQALATATAAVFAVNTVTGSWNLVESWKEPGKLRKTHSVLMLLADVALAATFATAPDDDDEGEGDDGGGTGTHRTLAIAAGGLTITGFALMIPSLLGRD